MGPIERELREYRLDVPEFWLESADRFSWRSFRVMRDAAFSLGIDSWLVADVEERIEEVLSEAIEAAEALGL